MSGIVQPYCTHNLGVKVGKKEIQCLNSSCGTIKSIDDYFSREDAYVGVVSKDETNQYHQRGYELYQLKTKRDAPKGGEPKYGSRTGSSA